MASYENSNKTQLTIIENQKDIMGFKVTRRSAGQWMTDGNPFYMDFLHEWMDNALQHETVIRACEPYAGTLSLIRYFDNDFPEISDNIKWSAFDISPAPCNERTVDRIDITASNTLFNIPGAPYDLIVTNPPYLARNSARRRKLDFPFDAGGIGINKPTDLYQFALDTCLDSADVCVMLIPESFITSKYDKTRCDAIISLRGDLFNDTDCPVCLALFSNARTATTKIIANDGSVIGNIEDIIRISDELIGDVSYDFVMNDPQGDVALFGVDSPSGATIRFAEGSEIPSSDIKNTSRALTRISRADHVPMTSQVVNRANEILSLWREKTGDVLMTSFKGTRKDGKYRRRLSFKEAQGILSRAINDIDTRL